MSTTADPAAIWREVGLRAPRFPLAARGAARYEHVPPGARLRDALERLGGVYTGLGCFLRWRADVLPSGYLAALRTLRTRAPVVPRATVAAQLRAACGAAGREAAAGLSPEPCWNTLDRCAYRTTWQGRPAVIQSARPPASRKDLDGLERALSRLTDGPLAAALSPGLLAQFRVWLQLGNSLARERSYLETLADFRGKSPLDFPVVIPELSCDSLLATTWIEGEPLGALLSRGSRPAVEALAEALLEQLCVLSVVDGDLDPDALVLTPAGRVAFRRATRLIAVPAVQVRTLLKYLSAVLARNAPVAGHQLLKLCGPAFAGQHTRLFDQLSSLEPELKVNLSFPGSAQMLESNWRAVARLGPTRPLFADCLHRNLLALGYWCGESAAAARDAGDPIEQAHWPVLGRLVRLRAGELARRDVVSDWVLGSGLLAFEGVRQMNRLLEDFRDDDFSIRVDLANGAGDGAGPSANRTVFAGVLGGILLILFLVCLRWAPLAGGPWQALLVAGAALAAVGVAWTITRIG